MGNFNPCVVRSRDAGFDLPCISTCGYCEEETDPYVSTPKEVQAVVDAARAVTAARDGRTATYSIEEPAPFPLLTALDALDAAVREVP